MEQTIKWVTSDEIPGDVLKNWMAMHERMPVQQLVRNVTTDVRCLSLNNEHFFPVTINHTEWENSYVVSPYNAYVVYAEEELQREIKNKAIVAALTPVIRGLGRYLKWTNANKVVHVNNFILSTNPYPSTWSGEGIGAIKDFLVRAFPGHAIIFRSLNDLQHAPILSAARRSGFINVTSRQVYMYNMEQAQWKKHNSNYQDLRLIRKNQLRYLDHDELAPHLTEALELYNKLYLEKYSQHNPQFTADYLRECHARRIMYFQGYVDEHNRLVAFTGLFCTGNTITSPLVGYDTSAPRTQALYAHCMQLIFAYKFKTGLILNLSSGAAAYKRGRGGIPVLEYSAIYCSHQPLKTRTMTRILAFVSNRIGKPLLIKYEL